MQNAHEREVATCHETVRILKQRLNEREEQFATQKRRKLPVDYYALKAKVCCSSCCSNRRNFKFYDNNDNNSYHHITKNDVVKDLLTNTTNRNTLTHNQTMVSLTENWLKLNDIDLKFIFVGILMLYNIQFIGSVLMSRNVFHILVVTVIIIFFIKLLNILRFL